MKKSKLLIIIIAIVVLVGGGVAAYFLLNNDEDGPSGGLFGIGGTDPSKELNPASLENTSFVQTTTSIFNGNESVGVVESDGKGLAKSTTELESGTLVIYADDNEGKVYSCMANEPCEVRDARNEDELPDFESDLENEKTYIGRADCPAGSCYKWQISVGGQDEDNANGESEMFYYIDTNNRLSVVEINSSGEGYQSSTRTVYEYKPVTITLPQV